MVNSYFVIELRVFLAVRVAQSTRAARNEDFIRASPSRHKPASTTTQTPPAPGRNFGIPPKSVPVRDADLRGDGPTKWTRSSQWEPAPSGC